MNRPPAPVASPGVAVSEATRLIQSAQANPQAILHWFSQLPEGSRDLLAYHAFADYVGLSR